MKRAIALKPDTDTVVEVEVIDKDQSRTQREFLVAHPPPGEPAGFIDNAEMLRRFPVSPGTLRNYREAGKLPFVRLGRRVLWHWPSVEAALVRMQRGGGQ